jgi:hypothetical protein
VKQLTQEK